MAAPQAVVLPDFLSFLSQSWNFRFPRLPSRVCSHRP